jgi:nucleoside 2-deoxyribosyltransferase
MERLLKEFTYRRKLALKGDDHEVTGRLIAFLGWMEGVRFIAPLLNKLRSEGGERLLRKALAHNNDTPDGRRHPLPPNARSVEEIASVGLALVEDAKQEERDVCEVSLDFGIDPGWGSAGRAAIGKYVVPFLDYLEQRLPVPERERHSSKGMLSPPSVIQESLKRFHAEHRDASSTCFVMMRFGKTVAHTRLEKTIKNSLKKHGLVGVSARDKEFHDDLYPNIQTYIYGCGFGIAVFERLESDEFNPNVALEVGYMFGLRKHVLLLKDRTVRALHTDLVGKLYREFDPQNPEETIPAQIDGWLSDKGLA